jgi:hypothetical protein
MAEDDTAKVSDPPSRAKLRPFVRLNLDVPFLALNPPQQSNDNGHYFSGDVPKSYGDEVVFGSTSVNYKQSAFGVIDLLAELVETHSGKVRPSQGHVEQVVANIRRLEPRFVCVIHSKVRDALNRHAGFTRELDYGICGAILPACNSQFVLNYMR